MYTPEEQKKHHDGFKVITDEMIVLYDQKNTKYAGAFDNTLNRWGLIAAGVRIEDKVSRMSSLIKDSSNCGDESIEDTLIDLANYSVMTLKFIREKRAEEARKREEEGYTLIRTEPAFNPSLPSSLSMSMAESVRKGITTKNACD